MHFRISKLRNWFESSLGYSCPCQVGRLQLTALSGNAILGLTLLSVTLLKRTTPSTIRIYSAIALSE